MMCKSFAFHNRSNNTCFRTFAAHEKYERKTKGNFLIEIHN